MSARRGTNGFTSCQTCGTIGHEAYECPLKQYFHQQAQVQIMKGSRDPEILREVYGARLEKQEPFQC